MGKQDEQPDDRPDAAQSSPMAGETSGMAESQYLVELQHTNRALRLLSSVNQALMHAATETALIQHICEIAVEIGEYRLAWVGFAEHDAQRTVRPICHAGNAQGYLEQIHFSWADDEQPCDPAGMAIRTRQPAIQEDIGRVAACAPWREAALSRGFHSTIALPLEIGGAVIGALALYGDRAYAFSPAEVALLTELAGDLSYGISALRTRERQRRAEAEVRGSAQRLHALIEAAPYGAHEYELQPDGRLLFIGYNPAANRILGVDHASLLGLTIDEAFPPLRHTPIPEAYRRVARTGERYEDEQVTYAHGEIVGTYEISAFQTAPGRMAVFFRDITERRRAERALRASEEKFAKAFYTSPDSININRLEDGVYVEINHGFTQMTGFTRDDVIGRSSLAGGIDIWVHPEDRQQLLTALRTHGELLGMEAEFRRKDGQLLTGSMSAKLIELNGDPCVLTITRDITERKLAAQQLQESEEKYRFLFDTMAQGVVFQDADTRIIEANRAASHILGLTMGQLLGASSYDPRWALIHEDHVPFGPEDMPSNIALRTGKPVTDVVCGVYFPEEQDYHWIIISSVPRCRVGDAKPALTMTTFTDITARKQAEDALRASEERLSHIIRNSPDLFYILDRELRYIWAPKTVIDLTEDETLGKTDHDVFSPEEAERLDAINRRVMATGESVRYEKDMPRDTTMLHYENTALPWRDAEGRITGVVVYAHDITERKQAEEALRAREALLRAVVDNAPFEFWARDIDGRCIMENKALVDHWGDLLGQLPEDAHLSPEELAIWQENNRRASAGDVVQVEVEYTVADERRVFQNIVAPIYVDGRLHGIMGFNIDITARKRAEEAMQRESTFLASAIELLPFPIFILTPCYEILRQNRASFALQQAPDTLPLGGVEFLDPQTHAPCPMQDWPISHALQGETTPTREFILRQHDGREMSILLQTAPIFINAELVAAVVAIQDISALKEADRAKNQFLMVLSHEVKTPLTSIIGWAQLAQSAPDIMPQALVTILRNAHAQQTLLERLLILSRILMGKLMLSRGATDLWQLACEAEQRLHHAAEERKISITMQPPGSGLAVEADAKLLALAICEVIDNAVNFTPAGGNITLHAHGEGGDNLLVVQDTGQGIEPEYLATLLKPFSQIARQEEIGGLGIGLALVRGIIEAHGGRVSITSAGHGHGTIVTIRLPRVGDSDRAPEGETRATAPGEGA